MFDNKIGKGNHSSSTLNNHKERSEVNDILFNIEASINGFRTAVSTHTFN